MKNALDSFPGIAFDAIIPMPLHRKKLIYRGYNQSELLTHMLFEHIHTPIDTDLKRHKHTNSQMKLSEMDRLHNVADIFTYSGKKYSSVLLIDDVATTLSTLHSAAKELKKHRVQTIGALVIAKTKH